MKLKLLVIYPSGRREIKLLDISDYYWEEHKFYYIPIYKGYTDCRYHTLEPNEDIIGLTDL